MIYVIIFLYIVNVLDIFINNKVLDLTKQFKFKKIRFLLIAAMSYIVYVVGVECSFK